MAPSPFAAEFEPALWDRRRRIARAPVSLEAGFGRGGINRAICRVADLSRSGARLEAFTEFESGSRIWLTLPGQPPRMAIVRWSLGYEAGCEFDVPLDEALWRALGGSPETS